VSEPAAAPGALAETLRRTHRRVDAALAEVSRCVAAHRHSEAQARLLSCAAEWEQQVRLEEELLYPLFELRLGTSGVGTAMLREEHKDLREAFAQVGLALERGDGRAAAEALDSLQGVLASHYSREERVVYPTLDAMLDDHERGRLLFRVDGRPPEGAAAQGPGQD